MKYLLINLLVVCSIIKISAQVNVDSIYIKDNKFYSGENKLKLIEVQKILKQNNSVAYKHFSKGISKKTFSYIIGFAGGYLIGYQVWKEIYKENRSYPGNRFKWQYAAGGILSISIAVGLNSSGQKNYLKALEIYNSGNRTSSWRNQ